MRGKYLICSAIAVLAVAVSVKAAQEPLQKVSPDRAGFTIMPLTNGDPSGPPTLDPTVPAPGPGAVAVVPEPSTIAMLFLGSSCAGAFTVLRRRRRA